MGRVFCVLALGRRVMLLLLLLLLLLRGTAFRMCTVVQTAYTVPAGGMVVCVQECSLIMDA